MDQNISLNDLRLLSKPKQELIDIRYSLSKSGVPPNSVLFGGTVPPNSVLFGGTVPPNSVLFGGTVPPNSFPLIKYMKYDKWVMRMSVGELIWMGGGLLKFSVCYIRI